MECQLRSIHNQYKYKKTYLDNHAQTLDVLILGSSHAYYNINPKYLDGNVFNAGAISQSLDLDLAILKKYETQFTQLKKLVIPVSYFSFYGRLQNSPEKWRMKDYVLYYDLNISSTLKDHFEILSIRPKNNLKKIKNSLISTTAIKPCSTLGWGDNYIDKGPRNLNDTGIETAKRHSENNVFSEESKEQFKLGSQDLISIIQWAKERHIEVVLITPPSYKSYTDHLNRDQLNQVVGQLNKLSNTYVNCNYFNLLIDNTFIADDFYDADHLNHRGAKKLSLQLNALIK